MCDALLKDLDTRITRLETIRDTAQAAQVANANTDHTLNEKQSEAVSLALNGENFVLTGAAGTGKTFTVNSIAEASVNGYMNPETGELEQRTLPMVEFRDPNGGVKDQETKPAIAFCAFTNRAVNNMANNLRNFSPDLMDELYSNYMTIHKLIEVAPEYYYDAEAQKDKIRFTPRRDEFNRLPIKLLIIEEASMVDLTLWDKLFRALEPDCQVILLGDLNQLPPVFGDSILNFGLIKLPVVELDHVYRQALDSPIIRQMHSLLKGNKPVTDTDNFQIVSGNSTKPIGPIRMGGQIAATMEKLFDMGKYDPMNDMILTPFNKGGCGTVTLNTRISSWLDDKCRDKGEPRMVYEIISGLEKHYFAVGDVVYDAMSKMQGTIKEIHLNGGYFGTMPQKASTELTRFGYYTGKEGDSEFDTLGEEFEYTNFNVDTLSTESLDDPEKTLMSSSHVVTVLLEDETEVSRSSAGEVNSISFGYCLTAHKAQGCEWDRVFILIHNTHFIANREWLYTACTRAKDTCMVFAKSDVLGKVVNRQRIKGDSLDAKIHGFNEKLEKKLANEGEGVLHQVTFNRREYVTHEAS